MEAAAMAVQDGVRSYPRRWLAAVVMVGAAMMDLIDITVVNVALPTIRADLGATGTQLEWVVSAYMLAFAATLPGTAATFWDAARLDAAWRSGRRVWLVTARRPERSLAAGLPGARLVAPKQGTGKRLTPKEREKLRKEREKEERKKRREQRNQEPGRDDDGASPARPR